MTSFGDDAAFDLYGETPPLSPEETLDEDELGADFDDGYSPPERPSGVTAYGTTAAEESAHEDLGHRLEREEPEIRYEALGDGIGDTYDTDGELIDDEVGDVRAGRLVFEDIDPADPGDDFFARDVGVDGAGASAEEASMHVVAQGDEF
ncbi:MAG TPA: DUF5709 domain-containing protein [Frankiaceae bacterium]|nr:DUF5709 domain-containing protein [Frankiaceae bacterium]